MSDFWKDYEPEPTRPAPMTKDEALDLALEALESWAKGFPDLVEALDKQAITAIKQARSAPVQEPVLQDIEQYRLQMAGISTAAIGYWKEGDGIHPDYDTPALRDVAKLYAKYDALYTAAQRPVAEPHKWVELDDDDISALGLSIAKARALESLLKRRNT